MWARLLHALRSLLHLQPEEACLWAGHGARIIAFLLVEEVAALISGSMRVSESLCDRTLPCTHKASIYAMSDQLRERLSRMSRSYLLLALLLVVVVFLYAFWSRSGSIVVV